MIGYDGAHMLDQGFKVFEATYYPSVLSTHPLSYLAAEEVCMIAERTTRGFMVGRSKREEAAKRELEALVASSS